MDDTDKALVALLRKNARMTVSDLASHLGVTRSTIRTRMQRLELSGEITGYQVVLRQDQSLHPVRGIMLLGIEGRGSRRIGRMLLGMTEVQSVHNTNGRWDMIVELGTRTLEELDQVLARIREMDGVATSETNLLLSSKTS